MDELIGFVFLLIVFAGALAFDPIASIGGTAVGISARQGIFGRS